MRYDDTAAIKQVLKDRILDLCRKLLPGGEVRGRFYVAFNPVTRDGPPQTPEFKVPLDRDIGAWIDWRTGEKGDVFKLISYVKSCDFKDTIAFARDFTGIQKMTREERGRLDRRTVEVQRDNQEHEEARKLKRLQAATRLFEIGLMDGAGSTAEAAARAYFAARAIPLERIPNRDLQTFRFSAGTEFWPRALWNNEGGRRIKRVAGPSFPAIHSAMRAPTGQLVAVHLTFLSPLGPKKLPVNKGENAKLMFGEAKGSVIRISHGPEGEPPETALVPHPVLIGEGIETTASVAMEAPEARAWAAGSLSNMANAPVWLPCVSAVIVLKDQFKSKTTEKQFARVLDELAQHGKPMTVIESHVGNDFNDLAKGEE